MDDLLVKYKGKENELLDTIRKTYKITTTKRLAFQSDEELNSKDHRGWYWPDKIPAGDQYCLCYEEDVLLRFGRALHRFAATQALQLGAHTVVRQTIFAALYTAVRIFQISQ